MNITYIYFCEKCSKRIPDADLVAKAASFLESENKAFCPLCTAAGKVSTPAPIPTSDNVNSNPDSSETVRTYQATKPARPKRPAPAEIIDIPEEKPNRWKYYAGAAGGAVLLLALLIFKLTHKAPPETRTVSNDPPARQTPALVKEPSVNPGETAKPPAQTLPVTSKTSEPAIPAVTTKLPAEPELKPALKVPEPTAPVDAPAQVVTNFIPPEQPNTVQVAGTTAPVVPPPPAKVVPPPPPVEPTFPEIMKPEELETCLGFERAFAALAKSDLETAQRTAQRSNDPGLKKFGMLLEKAKKLQEQAFENLSKSPPTKDVRVKVNNGELVGRLMRIDGTRAWIKMQNLEMPVEVSTLPHDLFVAAAGLETQTSEVIAKRGYLLLALGDYEPALAIFKRLKKEETGGWAEIQEQRTTLDRLNRFAKGVAEVETKIKNIQPREALAQMETLKRDFRDLSEGQKARFEYLATRADSVSAIRRIRNAFSGEVVAADEDLNVEVRYDFTKGSNLLKDFADNGLKQEADGVHVKMNNMNLKTWSVAGLAPLARFQPKKLRVEYVMQSPRHDITVGAVGNAHVKLRWIATGQISGSYEPKYSGDVFNGAAWQHPDLNGTYRYVFERTPETMTFSLDDKEHFKQSLPKNASEEKSWSTRIEHNTDFVIKELVIKGQVDQDWLKDAGKE